MLDVAYHYEVRQIRSGYILYRGTSLARAARLLYPGTCWGKGPTPATATKHIEVEVRKFQQLEGTR